MNFIFYKPLAAQYLSNLKLKGIAFQSKTGGNYKGSISYVTTEQGL